MVRRKLLQVGLLILAAVLVVAPALAASVANATFRGDLVCSNSSGDTLSNTCSAFNINTQALIGGDFVTDDLLNTAVQTPGGDDVAYMPGVGTNPWIIYSGTIGPYEQKNTFFYTGGPAMQAGFYYFPGTGGMTTPDSDSLELGNTFEIEQKGYIDTSSGTDKNLVYKETAFRTYVSGEESVSSIITNISNLVPDGAGDYTNIETVSGAPTHWEAVDDPPDDPDDNATVVSTTTTGFQKDAYNLEDVSIPSEATINSVTVYFRFRCGSSYWDAQAKPYLRLATSETTGTQVGENNAEWRDFSEVLSRPGGGDWAPADINNLQVVIGLKVGEASNSICTQIYVAVEWTLTVTAVSVSTGVHTIKTWADGTDLKISIDGATEGDGYDSETLDDTSVADNSNDWASLQNGSMIYMDYHKISVGGTLKQHIVYERATTFTDQALDSGTADSGTTTILVDDALTQADNYWNNIILEIVTTTDGEAPQGESATVTDFTAADDTLHFAALTAAVGAGDTYELRNDATPTFRTTSSGASISTTFDNYGPISEAVATITASEDIPGPLDDVTPTMPPEMYGELNTEHLPGASLINEMLGVGGIPQALFWIPFVFGLAALAVLIAYKFARSMVIIFTVGLCIVVFFALTGGGVVSFWAVIEYVVIGMALLVAEKHLAW